MYRHLQAAGVDVPPAIHQQGSDELVLKGAAMAHLVYPQPVLRPMRDLDLLVRAEEVYRAYALLPEIGAEPAPRPRPGPPPSRGDQAGR